MTILYILLVAINFSVHFLVLYRYSPLRYFRDVDVRSFLMFVLTIVLFVGLMLRLEGDYDNCHPNLRDATYAVASLVTSTGFGTIDFTHWPEIAFN